MTDFIKLLTDETFQNTELRNKGKVFNLVNRGKYLNVSFKGKQLSIPKNWSIFESSSQELVYPISESNNPDYLKSIFDKFFESESDYVVKLSEFETLLFRVENALNFIDDLFQSDPLTEINQAS